MNKYESVCILTSKLTNEEVANEIAKIQTTIKEFSDLPISIENIGKKKLAYEIKKNTEGIYLVIHFQAESECIYELERFYRINDNVIKFMVIRED